MKKLLISSLFITVGLLESSSAFAAKKGGECISNQGTYFNCPFLNLKDLKISDIYEKGYKVVALVPPGRESYYTLIIEEQ